MCTIWKTILILPEAYGNSRDEIDTNANVYKANSCSFKCKSSLIGNVVADGANGKK